MAERVILLKYGELILKGSNKYYFEKQLVENIKRRLIPQEKFDVRVMQSTVYVTPVEDSLTDDAFEALRDVFGIASMCIAYSCEKTLAAVQEAVRNNIVPELGSISSFKCDARRSDKSFPLTSPELSAEIGGTILEARPDLKVDLFSPEQVIVIEIRDKNAFVHAKSEKGAGGMPYGTSGRSLLLLSGGIDSPVAGYMIARRGAQIEALHFESYPYTSERALEKVISLGKLLTRYTGKMKLNIVSLTEIQLAIRDNCREEYFTLILRRFMMKIANIVAGGSSCLSITTGESLAQVASQTMPALGVTDAAAEYPVLRPCIGLDKNDIVEIARKIGTFETSILPYEDCCTLFTPRHPKLRPEMQKLLAEEAKLDCEALIAEAMKGLKIQELVY